MPEKLLQHDWIGFHAWARGAFGAGAHGDDGMCWEVADRGGNGILDKPPGHPTAQVPIADAQLVGAHGKPTATRIPACVSQHFRHMRHQAPLMTIEAASARD